MSDTFTITRLKPRGQWVLFRKCEKGDLLSDGKRGIRLDNGKELELPVSYTGFTNFAELIDIGSRCQHFRREHCRCGRSGEPGLAIWCPEMPDTLQCVDYEKFEYWMAKEDKIPHFVVTPQNIIQPLGENALIEMEVATGGKKVEIPDEAKVATSMGILRFHGEKPVKDAAVGDRVVIHGQHMTFGMNGKQYCVVSRRDIVGVLE